MFEEDSEWYPNKKQAEGKRPVPKVRFTQQKKRCVASAAMAIKEGGVEPTVDMVIARTPSASLNPDTGRPFDRKLILEAFRTLCYDDDPEGPWCHEIPHSKTAHKPIHTFTIQLPKGLGRDVDHQRRVWANSAAA